MIFYITAVANGFLNTVNKMVNVKAGECLGTANGALINYVEATIISSVSYTHLDVYKRQASGQRL